MLNNNFKINRPQIEPMLPLINIIFLLLIFFMVAGNTYIPIDKSIIPPQRMAIDADITDDTNQWVYLNKNGDLYYKNRPLTDERLIQEFNNKQLVLFADAKTKGADISMILARLNSQKIDSVLIISERSLEPNYLGKRTGYSND